MSNDTLRAITERLYRANERLLRSGDEADGAAYREAFDAWMDWCRQEFGDEDGDRVTG